MRKYLLILLALFAVLVSCAHMDWRQKDAAKQTKNNKAEKKPPPDSKEGPARKKIAACINDGLYASALDIIRAEIKAGSPEADFGPELVESVDGLADHGLRRYLEGEYELAGAAFRKALENIPSDGALRAKLRHPSEEIRGYVEKCSGMLMERGLLSYRFGNLGDAIAEWKKILAFDPENGEAKRAIETATVQMKNLRSIE